MFSNLKRVVEELRNTLRQWFSDVKLVKWRIWSTDHWIYARFTFRLKTFVRGEESGELFKSITIRFNSDHFELVGNFDPREGAKGE